MHIKTTIANFGIRVQIVITHVVSYAVKAALDTKDICCKHYTCMVNQFRQFHGGFLYDP